MSSLAKEIKRFACEILEVKNVSMWRRLRDIGLESLSFAELMAMTEDAFQVKFPVEDITRFRNLYAVVRRVRRLLK